jgi:hypothetical protein
MYVYTYIRMYVYVCMYVCMYVCVCVSIYIYMRRGEHFARGTAMLLTEPLCY